MLHVNNSFSGRIAVLLLGLVTHYCESPFIQSTYIESHTTKFFIYSLSDPVSVMKHTQMISHIEYMQQSTVDMLYVASYSGLLLL